VYSTISIISLHFIVTEDGVIPESILVFTVRKTESTLDYHDNIDSTKFRRWTDTLINALDAKKKEVYNCYGKQNTA